MPWKKKEKNYNKLVYIKRQRKIQELQSRIESIKKTVQTLDESFYSGAISEEIYSQSREPLMKKITALIEEIEQLKS